MRRSGSEEIGSPSRVRIAGAGGFPLFGRQKQTPISLVNSRAEALGHQTRRSPGRFCRAYRMRLFGRDTRFCLHKQVSYPAPLRQPAANLRTRRGNSVRRSRGKNVRHYSTVTIVSEDSPHCGQVGRVRRVFWRRRVPWVLVRLRLGGTLALPWASTDLLAPPLEIDPRPDEASTALLSPMALRDLARFFQNRPMRGQL
jgi:hypothetical protein